MKIAFYAPLKSPNHPVPSGDRLMARMLIKAMQIAGHEVSLASELRSFLREPDGENHGMLKQAAETEKQRIATQWQRDGRPDVWFCYHPYYKARDLLGPDLCRHFGIPYVTAEASYSPKRNATGWAQTQQELLDDISFAAVNICFTDRDKQGLLNASHDIGYAMLPPFIDAGVFGKVTPSATPYRMAAVAMMREGDKLSSFRALANALQLLPPDHPWTLDIIGDGPAREAVQKLFEAIDSDRVVWHGEQSAEAIADILSRASLYVWPGHGEAYGLAYLEAQATGLPVVAEKIAGVPEVVEDGETGILTPSGDTKAYADALMELMSNEKKRHAMAVKARHFATVERSMDKAAITLDNILNDAVGRKP